MIQPASPSIDPLPEQAPPFARLYREQAGFVWKSLQRMGVASADLEDALQEVFIVAHRRFNEYDAARGRPSTWLFGIALNVARNAGRSRRRRREADEPQVVTIDHTTPEDALRREQARSLAQSLLEQLSPEHRSVFVMFEVEGMSCAEIAAMIGVPTGTVHSRLHAARQRLGTVLARSGKRLELQEVGRP